MEFKIGRHRSDERLKVPASNEEFEERFQRVSSMDFKAPTCSKLIKGLKDTKREDDHRETAPMTIEALDEQKDSRQHASTPKLDVDTLKPNSSKPKIRHSGRLFNCNSTGSWDRRKSLAARKVAHDPEWLA